MPKLCRRLVLSAIDTLRAHRLARTVTRTDPGCDRRFNHAWSRISATIPQQNFWDADPQQPGGHHNRPRRHSQNLKSP
jgi:hypothetical protein